MERWKKEVFIFRSNHDLLRNLNLLNWALIWWHIFEEDQLIRDKRKRVVVWDYFRLSKTIWQQKYIAGQWYTLKVKVAKKESIFDHWPCLQNWLKIFCYKGVFAKKMHNANIVAFLKAYFLRLVSTFANTPFRFFVYCSLFPLRIFLFLYSWGV